MIVTLRANQYSKSSIFCDSPLAFNGCFVWIYSLHLQCWGESLLPYWCWFPAWVGLQPWRWKPVPQKGWLTLNGLHGNIPEDKSLHKHRCGNLHSHYQYLSKSWNLNTINKTECDLQSLSIRLPQINAFFYWASSIYEIGSNKLPLDAYLMQWVWREGLVDTLGHGSRRKRESYVLIFNQIFMMFEWANRIIIELFNLTVMNNCHVGEKVATVY